TQLFYGTAGPAFVEAIAADVERIKHAARLRIDAVERDIVEANADGQASRVARRFAVVAVAGEFAREAIELPWAQDEPIEAARELYKTWLSERGGHGPAEVLRGWEAIRDAIEKHGAARFEDDRDGHRSNMRVANRLGWRMDFRGTDCWCFSIPG